MNAALRSIESGADASAERWKVLQSSFDTVRSPDTDLISLAQRSHRIPPVIIVGAGPAAQECARQLSSGMEGQQWLLLFNGEAYLPYHRAQISTVLNARGRVDALLTHDFPSNVTIAHRTNVAVIEPQAKKIYTDQGVEFHYSKLVLATGSQSRRPVIPGLHGSRVFDFRQLDDIEKIAALAPRRVAVLGGGLLGIEAARALHAFCDDVTVFVRSSHLLSRHIDSGAGERVAWHLRQLGIQVKVAAQLIAAEVGYGQITLQEECEASSTYDAVVCATGISPNIALAEHAQLQYRLGVEVNDAQQSSDPDIYAIGECSERNGKIGGNLSTSLDQARRAAAAILNQATSPASSIEVFQLKMDSCVVVTMGEVIEDDGVSVVHAPDEKSYRRVFVRNQQLVGAILVGEKGLDVGAFADAIEKRSPWSDTIERRFIKTGQLPHGGKVPADTVICFCTGTTHGRLTELRAANHSYDSITTLTGATLHCGSCTQRVTSITADSAGSTQSAQPAAFWASAVLAALTVIAALTASVIPFAKSWQSSWRMIDVLWRGFMAKQLSGYALLLMMLMAFLPALSRRIQRKEKRPQKLLFMSWHLISASIVVGGFIVHTGARMGYGLNSVLSITFMATLFLGGLASLGWRYASRGHQHRSIATNIRTLHWALLFPLPAILISHVLKIYYF